MGWLNITECKPGLRRIEIRTFIESSNVILHSIGIYLLASLLRRRVENDTQGLYLLNLSCSQLLWNIVGVTSDIMRILCYHGKGYSFYTIACYMDTCMKTGVSYNVIIAMFYFTADRLSHILLHVRYEQYWNTNKTYILIVCTWVFNAIICTVFLLLKYSVSCATDATDYVLARIIKPVIMTVYLIFVIVAYSIMFIIYVKSERKIKGWKPGPGAAPPPSKYNIFKSSRFFISMIIIGNYLLLTVIPNIILSILSNFVHSKTRNMFRIIHSFQTFYFISTRLSHTIDAVVYIFLKKPVRTLLKKKLSCYHYSPINQEVSYMDEMTENTIILRSSILSSLSPYFTRRDSRRSVNHSAEEEIS